ncbi:hypothetical protein [Dactylosporangium sp. NPDC005555]|uniref:hypothetical protein n=1 Tax=Dactylosporangium sp. NPDC005555 TaxID=3154889 RepID=UPI0033A4D599
MQLRRIILALSAVVALTAACSSDPGSTSAAGSSAPSAVASAPAAGASAAASQPADVKANTEAVCKAVIAAYDKEKEELTAILGEVIMASVKEDKAALATAKAKGQVVIDRLDTAVDAELAKAADPQAKAALRNFVTAFSKILAADNFANSDFEATLDKATTEATKYCPALTA